MASKFSRLISKTSISSLKSVINVSTKSSSSASAARSTATHLPRSSSTSTAVPRFNFSRVPKELGGALSLIPLHSAVAVARMTSCLSVTSRSCRALSQGTLCRTSPDL
ncbi:unnamed protein product [Amaranthus hypochondriacus]